MASGNLGVILHENGRGVLCGLEEKEEARARARVSALVLGSDQKIIQ
jgi:hypothetical protein